MNFVFDMTGYTYASVHSLPVTSFFDNRCRSSDLVSVEFYDHDTIGKDEKMGFAMFQLDELYVRPH